jgi:hypothetical protein
MVVLLLAAAFDLSIAIQREDNKEKGRGEIRQNTKTPRSDKRRAEGRRRIKESQFRISRQMRRAARLLEHQGKIKKRHTYDKSSEQRAFWIGLLGPPFVSKRPAAGRICWPIRTRDSLILRLPSARHLSDLGVLVFCLASGLFDASIDTYVRMC